MAHPGHRLGPVLAVLGDADHPARAGKHVLTVAPAEDAGVRGLTIDRVRVARAARLGYAAMQASLLQAVGGHASV